MKDCPNCNGTGKIKTIGQTTLDDDWFDTMRIDCPPGTKVRFKNQNGHDYQKEEARTFFKKGDVLTVSKTEIHSSRTDVCFEETGAKKFNSVMFEEIK